MARRVIDWISTALRDPDVEAEVHFHRGPQSIPAACHDPRCRSPRLDARAAHDEWLIPWR